MMSQKQSEIYIIEENKRLQTENEELKEKISDYQEEIESCTNDEKTISNLRMLLHNLNSISTHRNEIINFYEEHRKINVDYIKDCYLSQNLYVFSFIVVLVSGFLLDFIFFYAAIFIAICEIYINSTCLYKFENSLKKISKTIFDKQEICNKEVKNMEIFDQLIDSV